MKRRADTVIETQKHLAGCAEGAAVRLARSRHAHLYGARAPGHLPDSFCLL